MLFWWIKRKLVPSNGGCAYWLSAVTPLDPMTQIAGEWWGLACWWLITWKGEAGSAIPAETLIWILGESALPTRSPITLIRTSRVIWSCSWHVWLIPAQKLYFFNQNQFPTLTQRYRENECWRAGVCIGVSCTGDSQILMQFFFCTVMWLMARHESHQYSLWLFPRGASVSRCCSPCVQMERLDASHCSWAF